MCLRKELYLSGWFYPVCGIGVTVSPHSEKNLLRAFLSDLARPKLLGGNGVCHSGYQIYNYEKHRRWKWEEIQTRLYKVNKRVLNITNTQNLGVQFIENI